MTLTMNLAPALKELAHYGDIAVQCHDIPDADAIASGFATAKFMESHGASVRLIYSGRERVTKPDLTAMLDLLNIPLEHVEELPPCRLLITVDSQYGAGNIRKFDLGRGGSQGRGPAVAVFDHHRSEILNEPGVIYQSIVPSLGSCSTLIWDLMTREGFDFAAHTDVVTALYYGLFTDTNSFAEMRHPKDRDLADVKGINWQVIKKLKYSSLTIQDLKVVANALASPSLVGRIGLLEAEPCDPNLLGFSCDIARSVKQFDCSVVYCRMTAGLKLSIRSAAREVMANELAAFLTRDVGSGGGNIEKAGGHIGYAGVEKAFPGIPPEDFLLKRIEEYQTNFDHVYWDNHGLDFASMLRFRKLKIPVGFAPSAEVFPDGTPITVRTLEGDVDLESSAEVYLMIGAEGEVYPIGRAKHQRDYDAGGEPYAGTGAGYEPVIIDRSTGRKESLLPFARLCVAKNEKRIRARELARDTKVFTRWDEEKYFYGRTGDYIAAPEPAEPGAKYDDVYIIRRDIFEKTYARAE